MKYMGSKNRYAKELLPIILKDRTENQWYVEPFVGGCNMIDKVIGNRIGSDSHRYLIGLWKALQMDGFLLPENISNDEYDYIRKNKDGYPPALVGFVGFGCSYAGKWFGGYARGNDKNGDPRNYCAESRRNVQRQRPKLKGVHFECIHYASLQIPPESIVYCDPPYQHTTKYKGKFDHAVFWWWCEGLARAGHSVFVSEYKAPVGWVSVWERKVNNTLTKDTGSKQGVEKLFVFNAELKGE